MKDSFRIILVILLSVALVGCGKSTNDRKAVGTWKLETPADSKMSATLDLAKDGKWSETYDSPWVRFSASGTWKLESGTLVRTTETHTANKARIGVTEH